MLIMLQDKNHKRVNWFMLDKLPSEGDGNLRDVLFIVLSLLLMLLAAFLTIRFVE